MNPVNEFYQELGKILSPYKDDLQDLSEKTNVSKVTLWRWINAINTNYPDADRLYRVLAVISGLSKRLEIAEYFGGKIESTLKNIISIGFTQINFPIIEKNHPTEFLPDFYSRVIYYITSTERGASEKELINIIGNLIIKKSEIPQTDITQEIIDAHGIIAKKKIEYLVQKELVYKKDDKYHSFQKDFQVPTDFNIEFSSHLIKETFKKDEIDNGIGFLGHYVESIPLSVAQQIRSKSNAFYKECLELMIKNKDPNGIPFSFISFTESLWFDQIKFLDFQEAQ